MTLQTFQTCKLKSCISSYSDSSFLTHPVFQLLGKPLIHICGRPAAAGANQSTFANQLPHLQELSVLVPMVVEHYRILFLHGRRVAVACWSARLAAQQPHHGCAYCLSKACCCGDRQGTTVLVIWGSIRGVNLSLIATSRIATQQYPRHQTNPPP